MGTEEATKKGEAQECFYKKPQRCPAQPMADWVNVFEKAVLVMIDEGLNVELQEHGLAPFREDQF